MALRLALAHQEQSSLITGPRALRLALAHQEQSSLITACPPPPPPPPPQTQPPQHPHPLPPPSTPTHTHRRQSAPVFNFLVPRSVVRCIDPMNCCCFLCIWTSISVVPSSAAMAASALESSLSSKRVAALMALIACSGRLLS
jgi:hypothetical protein